LGQVTTLTGTAGTSCARTSSKHAGAITGLNDERLFFRQRRLRSTSHAIKTGNALLLSTFSPYPINGSARRCRHKALAAWDNAPTNFNAALS